MTQILHVKRKDPATGGEKRLELKVVRTWTSPAGILRLLADGDYVQADGSPPGDVGLLNVIADPNQRAAAEAWWQRKGQQRAQTFYRRRDQAISARRADAEATAGVLTARYFRLPAGGAEREGPFAWAECFPAAPPWWGRVDMTMVDGTAYVREGVNLDPNLARAVARAGGEPEKAGGGDDDDQPGDGEANPAQAGGQVDDPGHAEPPPMDPLLPVVVTIYKRRDAKQPSRRFTGPYQQAMADAHQWLAEKDAQEYADAWVDVLPVGEEAAADDGTGPAPAAEDLADAPAESI